MRWKTRSIASCACPSSVRSKVEPMYFAFTPEQEAFRETIRDFIKRECPPDLDRRLDDEGRYPFELVDKVVETGLLGLPFSEEYGGTGGGVMEFVIAMEEVCYGSAAVAS